MPDLEPITRDEKLWSGEDLEPKTRREMYIKHLYDETQVIPDSPITREEMFILKAGEELHDVTIEQLTATENRTYSEEGVAYSPVIVNVPQTTLTTLDVTENGTYTAPSGTAYNEVEVDVPLPENAYLLKDIPNTPTAIATFSDGANLPMPKLEAYIEPQQDLHGYDSPWVGGAGKNKCGEFELGTLSESSAQGSTYDNMKVSNTARMRSKTLIEIPSTCTISCANGYQYAFAGYDANMEYLGVYQFYTWRSEAYTFNNSTIKYIAIIIKRTDEGNIQSNDYTNCHIQLEEGSTATTFAPYSNICPISGWSEVNVSFINDSTKAPFFKGLLNGTYNFNDLGLLTWFKSGDNIFYTRLPEHKVVAGDSSINAISSNGMDFLQMPGSGNGEYIMITDSDYASYTAVQFREAMNGVYLIYELATPTTPTITPQQFNTLLEAFNIDGCLYTIDLDGTRYGGKVDLVSGVLTVTHGYQDLGVLGWDRAENAGIFRFQSSGFSGGKAEANNKVANIICENYKADTWNNTTGTEDNGTIALLSTGNIIAIQDNGYTDASAFKTAMNGVQLVYELATPLTIQLTPTQVSSLLGVNNVWADCGDIIDGQYFSKEV